jgi:hypothetical protein
MLFVLLDCSVFVMKLTLGTEIHSLLLFQAI